MSAKLLWTNDEIINSELGPMLGFQFINELTGAESVVIARTMIDAVRIAAQILECAPQNLKFNGFYGEL